MGANYDRRSARMWRMQTGTPFTMYGVLFDCFPELRLLQVLLCKAHFRTESIGASPVIIACNLGKLFMFFYLASQC